MGFLVQRMRKFHYLIYRPILASNIGKQICWLRMQEDLGDKFTAWIKLLYSNTRAQILTDRMLSLTSVCLVAQGRAVPYHPSCLGLLSNLLPSLFTQIYIILMALASGKPGKIFLFADDVFLFITRPRSSLSVVLDKINLFVIFLGFQKLENMFAPMFPLLKMLLLQFCLSAFSMVALLEKYHTFSTHCNLKNPPSMLAISIAWGNGPGIQIPDEICEQGLEEVNSFSVNSWHCVIQFLVIHRLHCSKSKLHQMFPDISPTCDKCDLAEADLLHSSFLSQNRKILDEYFFNIL